MSEQNLITEDDFFETFDPREMTDDGDTVIDVVPPGTPDEHVWTIVDGDSGDLYASAGWHRVNRFGYVITTRPWVTGDEVALWHHFEDDTRPGTEPSTDPSTDPSPGPGVEAAGDAEGPGSTIPDEA